MRGTGYRFVPGPTELEPTLPRADPLGTERPGAKEQALRVGADAYLAKPFEPVVLIDAISSAFARRVASRSAQHA